MTSVSEKCSSLSENCNFQPPTFLSHNTLNEAHAGDWGAIFFIKTLAKKAKFNNSLNIMKSNKTFYHIKMYKMIVK